MHIEKLPDAEESRFEVWATVMIGNELVMLDGEKRRFDHAGNALRYANRLGDELLDLL